MDGAGVRRRDGPHLVHHVRDAQPRRRGGQQEHLDVGVRHRERVAGVQHGPVHEVGHVDRARHLGVDHRVLPAEHLHPEAGGLERLPGHGRVHVSGVESRLRQRPRQIPWRPHVRLRAGHGPGQLLGDHVVRVAVRHEDGVRAVQDRRVAERAGVEREAPAGLLEADGRVAEEGQGRAHADHSSARRRDPGRSQPPARSRRWTRPAPRSTATHRLPPRPAPGRAPARAPSVLPRMRGPGAVRCALRARVSAAARAGRPAPSRWRRPPGPGRRCPHARPGPPRPSRPRPRPSAAGRRGCSPPPPGCSR